MFFKYFLMYFIITKDKNQLQHGLNSGETYSFSFNPSKTFESSTSECSVYPTYDCFIRTVIYPKDVILTTPHKYSSSFGDSCEYVKFKFNSNKILVGEAYPLYDIKTIKKFNIKISDNYVRGVSAVGNINVLEYLNLNGWNIIQYCEGSLTNASGNGHVKVLDWWLESGMPLKYDENALVSASGNGHVEVLEWWLKSGLKLKYNRRALHSASNNGHINVLDWWFKSGLPLKYEKYPVYYNHTYERDEKVAQWWKNSGLLNHLKKSCSFT
jgi:hypothetical protein